ncbi:unnamed protein product [Arctogadus glacialis]
MKGTASPGPNEPSPRMVDLAPAWGPGDPDPPGHISSQEPKNSPSQLMSHNALLCCSEKRVLSQRFPSFHSLFLARVGRPLGMSRPPEVLQKNRGLLSPGPAEPPLLVGTTARSVHHAAPVLLLLASHSPPARLTFSSCSPHVLLLLASGSPPARLMFSSCSPHALGL